MNDLLETRDHQYWVATTGGLVRFDPAGTPRSLRMTAPSTGRPPSTGISAMFTLLAPSDPDPASKTVNVLLEDRDGTIWCGTGKGLYRLEQTGGAVLRAVDLGMPHDHPLQAFVSALVEDRTGTLWAASPSGLYRLWRDGHRVRYTERDGLPIPYDHVHDLLLDDQDRLWVATRHGGFFQMAADRSRETVTVIQTFTVRDGLLTPWIFCLFETSNHRFWAGTNQGLVEFFPSAGDRTARFRTHTTDQGLSFREITALSEDASGNLWLGTNTSGVMRLTTNGLITYRALDGVSSVNAIFEDGAGNLCVRGRGLDTSDKALDVYGRFEGRFTWFKPAAVGNPGWVMEQVTLRARTGDWWVGTGAGVYRFPAVPNFASIESARPLARYTSLNGLSAGQIFRLFEDSRGNIWVATIAAPLGHIPYRGLARWDRATGRWRDVSRLVLQDDLPVSFAEDRDGQVWLGFNTRLVRYAAGRFISFSAKDGLPPGAIADMHIDRAGRLWLASSRSGLIRVDDLRHEHPTFSAYTTVEGLASNSTDVITEDLYGRIYVGTGRGLDRLDPTTGRVNHFTTADGLAPGLFRAAFRDHTGALWFGMTGGLSRLVPAADSPSTSPSIFVNGLMVSGARRPLSAIGERAIALADLAPGSNQLQIDFVGLAFASGETLRYQYRLEGADRDWSAPTEQRSITYANLAPGQYRFLVRAMSADGTPSAVPAVVTFMVMRPIWARWWFVLLAAAAAAAAGRAVYRTRMARIFELANMRARIAADLHDDIGANLTKIAILSEVAQQQIVGASHSHGPRAQNPVTAQNAAAGRHSIAAPAPETVLTPDTPLASIARISRESVAAMSDIVWAINPQRDRLVDLVRRMRQHADEVFTTCGVKLTFVAPVDAENIALGPDVRRDVYLIFKEAINNAARHASCAQVTIEIRSGSGCLLLDVADDGIGFDTQAPEEGHGLSSMRRRAARLGGQCDIRSTRDRGTRVRIRIPTAGGR